MKNNTTQEDLNHVNIMRLKLYIKKIIQQIVLENFNKINKLEIIINKITEQLTELKNFKIIQDYKIENITSLWNSWNYKQKIIWLLLNKLKIGFFKINKYNKKIYDLYDENNILIVEDYIDKNKKFWFELNPKSILIHNLAIQPILPKEEYITINLTIHK